MIVRLGPAIVLLLSLNVAVSADVLRAKKAAAFGAGANVLLPLGYFAEHFSAGYGLNGIFRLPAQRFFHASEGKHGGLFFETGLHYTAQGLSTGNASSMATASWHLGAGWIFWLHRYAQPTLSFNGGVFYNRLNLAARNETYHAFNPMVRAKASVFSEITPSVFTELTLSVPFYYLGDRNLYGFEVSVGANYSIPDDALPLSPADEIFRSGKLLYDQNRFDEAEVKFSEALKVDTQHALSLRYRRMVRAQDSADRARSAKTAGDVFTALQLMQSAVADLPELLPELKDMRATLEPSLPQLVEQAIRDYDSKRYAECEKAMERVLLVSPEHEQARLYLPRARSRRQAMEKLQ